MPRITSPFQVLNPIILFAAFVLLLLVSLSLPIIKPIYLFQLNATPSADTPQTSVADMIRAGLWGYCASGYEFENGGQQYVDNYYCTPAKVGYKFDPIILGLIAKSSYQKYVNFALDSLPYVLVLHPVAAGLTLLALIPNVVRLFKSPIPEAVQIIDLLVEIIPTLFATLMFIIDIALVIVARHEMVSSFGTTVTVSWGPAVWMTCAAMVCLWIGLIGLSAYACGCCGLSNQTVRLRMSKKFVYVASKEKFEEESA